MNSMIYKKKSPLLIFLIPAFLLMTVFLYYPFVTNIVNSFMPIQQLGANPGRDIFAQIGQTETVGNDIITEADVGWAKITITQSDITTIESGISTTGKLSVSIVKNISDDEDVRISASDSKTGYENISVTKINKKTQEQIDQVQIKFDAKSLITLESSDTSIVLSHLKVGDIVQEDQGFFIRDVEVTESGYISNLNVQKKDIAYINDPWYENYQKLFNDAKVGTALMNTGIFMVLVIIFQVGIALVLALLVENINRGAQFFRTVYFFPIVISGAALALMFNLIFQYNGGAVNSLLYNMGVTNSISEIDWKDTEHFWFTMALPVLWQYVGYYFVIIVTGLNNISADIYEAAMIDGASGMKRVFKITLPLLHNTLVTCIILAVTGAIKIFDLPFVMFRGGMPEGKSWLLGTYMYNQTFDASNVDYGSTIAILIVVAGVLVSQIVNRVLKDKDY